MAVCSVDTRFEAAFCAASDDSWSVVPAANSWNEAPMMLMLQKRVSAAAWRGSPSAHSLGVDLADGGEHGLRGSVGGERRAGAGDEAKGHGGDGGETHVERVWGWVGVELGRGGKMWEDGGG